MNDFERAIEELKKGNYSEGKAILLDILEKEPDNERVLFNLGMCYSEMEMFEKSVEVLEKCISIDPAFSNALVALGFSNHQLGRNDKAVTALLLAAQYEPDNFYALKNIGAIYGKMGEIDKAISYLEKANALSPNVLDVLITLLHAYEQNKTLDKANDICKQIMALNPPDKIKLRVEESLTRIAMTELKSKGPRFDAVMYCLKALELYSTMNSEKVKEIAFEIAVVGMGGLSINDMNQQYTLKSLEGTFSGLQLLCYMFVGFKQVDNNLPPVADLESEYESALKLFKRNTNEH